MTLSTNHNLEQLFDLPTTTVKDSMPVLDSTQKQQALAVLDDAIDKIDAALPAVKGLEASDSEMDSLADLATSSYRDLMDLGMQIDSRFASEIFSVASNMLGHAITAKTAKLDKKLKMIDLQLKKARLDQQSPQSAVVDTGNGHVLDRNQLLEKLLADRRQSSKENK